MLGQNLPSVEWAGMTLGVREGVLGLIVLIALYVLVMLWRMRHHLKRDAQGSPAMPPVEPSPHAVAVAAEPLPASGLADAVMTQGVERELAQLREEVDAIRGELAALRDDMQSELGHMRATQSVSPIYGDAMQMAVAGYDAAMISERCGIARAEAELVVALARSQHS